MTPDELDAIRVVVHAEMHNSEEAESHGFRLRLWHRCVLIVVTFGVGVALHHLIENEALRSATQSVELSLSALFAFLFDKAREVGK